MSTGLGESAVTAEVENRSRDFETDCLEAVSVIWPRSTLLLGSIRQALATLDWTCLVSLVHPVTFTRRKERKKEKKMEKIATLNISDAFM